MDILRAAAVGDLARVRALVEQDQSVVHARPDLYAWTPLLHAAHNGHTEVVLYLLDHGAAIDHQSTLGDTALLVASCNGRGAQVVRVLLERGADATVPNICGDTALINAASMGSDAAVRMLLEHGGSDVDAQSDYDGGTPMHRSAERGHRGVVRQLLEAGADPTLLNVPGYTTAVGCAARSGRQECVRILHEWQRAYTLHRARSIRESSLLVGNSSAAVDAAPTYLTDRATAMLTMPTVHVSSHQQQGEPSDGVGEEGHVESDPVVIGDVVALYVIEELNGEVFVEWMELMGSSGCDNDAL